MIKFLVTTAIHSLLSYIVIASSVFKSISINQSPHEGVILNKLVSFPLLWATYNFKIDGSRIFDNVFLSLVLIVVNSVIFTTIVFIGCKAACCTLRGKAERPK